MIYWTSQKSIWWVDGVDVLSSSSSEAKKTKIHKWYINFFNMENLYNIMCITRWLNRIRLFISTYIASRIQILMLLETLTNALKYLFYYYCRLMVIMKYNKNKKPRLIDVIERQYNTHKHNWRSQSGMQTVLYLPITLSSRQDSFKCKTSFINLN